MRKIENLEFSKKEQRFVENQVKIINTAIYHSCLFAIIIVILLASEFKSFPYSLLIIFNIFTYKVSIKCTRSFVKYSIIKPVILGISSTLLFSLLSAIEVEFIINIKAISTSKHILIWLLVTLFSSFSIFAIAITRAIHININRTHKKNRVKALKSYKVFIEVVGLIAVILAFAFVIQGQYEISPSEKETWELLVKYFAFPVGLWMSFMKIHYEHLK